MDDLLGSGSGILNGLRDQRSTLKVCAYNFIQKLESHKQSVALLKRKFSSDGKGRSLDTFRLKFILPDPVSGVHIDHNSLIVSAYMLGRRVSLCFQGGDGLPGFASGLLLSGCVC